MLETPQNEAFGCNEVASLAGLVSSSTSSGDDRVSAALRVPAGAVELDAVAGRMKRMRAAVLTWARISDQWTAKTGYRYRPLFVTLTYAAGDAWEPKAISDYLKRLDSWKHSMQRKHGCTIHIPYVWTLELQKRGAPHYHLVVWLPSFLYLPKPDELFTLTSRSGRVRVCSPMWPWGDSQTVVIKWGAVPYIAKYVSKGPLEQGQAHELPTGARVHGTGGVPRQSIESREARWWRLPAWLRDALPLSSLTMVTGLARRSVQVFKAKVREPRTGRFAAFFSEAGELFASPWAVRFCRITGRTFIWRIDDVSRTCA